MQAQPIKITRARLWQVNLPLRQPFRSSEGIVDCKPVVLLELTDAAGRHGYGEGSAF